MQTISRDYNYLSFFLILFSLPNDSECEAGTCIRPNVCDCNDDYYGPLCSSKCTCKNGECADGQLLKRVEFKASSHSNYNFDS